MSYQDRKVWLVTGNGIDAGKYDNEKDARIRAAEVAKAGAVAQIYKRVAIFAPAAEELDANGFSLSLTKDT